MLTPWKGVIANLIYDTRILYGIFTILLTEKGFWDIY